jgi:hypothetical protein
MEGRWMTCPRRTERCGRSASLERDQQETTKVKEETKKGAALSA